MVSPLLVLLTNALRLSDNVALTAAVDTGRPVIPVFIHDEQSPKARPLGAASKWWLMCSLEKLSADLRSRGSQLVIRKGRTIEEVEQLLAETGANGVYFSRGYTPGIRAVETEMHDRLSGRGIEVRRFGGHLLLEPELIRTKTGSVYGVFTPFWRTASELIDTVKPLSAPAVIPAPTKWPGGLPVENLDLEPRPAHWAESIAAHWQPGEAAALKRLGSFLDGGLTDYKVARDFPAIDATSALSPHLAFGEVSPRTIWWQTKKRMAEESSVQQGGNHFLREMGWREFSCHLLFNQPQMQTAPMREQFAAFPWRTGPGGQLTAWQQGQTGFPIVDAGMRQLWQTGWMHNRVRMIVASFLVKDLLWHWRDGENWFWDTLVDADFGNNIASWQWVAGCGADAAPYFRIFNPVTQGRKFDPDGSYVRRYVPELGGLPDKFIHDPLSAPADVLDMAGVLLGETYPHPIVDRSHARERALAALASIRKPAVADS